MSESGFILLSVLARRAVSIFRAGVCLASLLGCVYPLGGAGADRVPWARHVIDGSSQGADGVRLADVNGDGLPDLVTGWEEGGLVRLYLHPSARAVRDPWPAVTVGQAPSVEDAVLVDLDGDGYQDVVSACEGGERSLRVHWSPSHPERYGDSSAWLTERVLASRRKMMWMFTMPVRWMEEGPLVLVAAGKGSEAELGWFAGMGRSRRTQDWTWHSLRSVGWVMSLRACDVDGDGDEDLLFTDRKGRRSGCYWMENPGMAWADLKAWKEHAVGAQGREVMFLAVGDLDGDRQEEIAVAIQPRSVAVFRRQDPHGRRWAMTELEVPDWAGMPKAVQMGDLDLDGRPELVLTCEGARPPRSGVMAWKGGPAAMVDWAVMDVSGPEGVKYDLVELLDLDQDGDLDLLTCEETANLGVIWYENPAR